MADGLQGVAAGAGDLVVAPPSLQQLVYIASGLARRANYLFISCWFLIKQGLIHYESQKIKLVRLPYSRVKKLTDAYNKLIRVSLPERHGNLERLTGCRGSQQAQETCS